MPFSCSASAVFSGVSDLTMTRPPIRLQPAPLLWTLTLARLARANPQITPAQLDTWLRPARLFLVTTDDEPPTAVLLAGSSFGAHMLRLRYADAISRDLAEILRRPVTLIVHHPTPCQS